MEDEYTLLEEKKPDKGKNIIGLDEDDEVYYCFRCNCKNPECNEWRCSVTGYGLMVDIIKWKYE